MNITLIGMPGSGKSYHGRKLAAALDFVLVDFDKLLEVERGLPLQQILDEMGEDAFLQKQSEDAVSYTKGKEGLIISTPGSMVYTEEAMKFLNDISIIVYLKTDIDTLKSRIKGIPRGIVGLNDKTFEELYTERTQLYERWAELTVETNQSEDTILEKIISFSKNN